MDVKHHVYFMSPACHTQTPPTPTTTTTPATACNTCRGSYSGQNGGVKSRLHSLKKLKASVAYREYNGDSVSSVNKGLYRVSAKE